MLLSCSSLNPFSGIDIDEIPLTEGEIPFKLPPGLYTDVDGEKHNPTDERWSISEEDLFKGVIEEDINTLEQISKWAYLASALVVGLGTGVFMGKKKPS